jgi:hypothetical protein
MRASAHLYCRTLLAEREKQNFFFCMPAWETMYTSVTGDQPASSPWSIAQPVCSCLLPILRTHKACKFEGSTRPPGSYHLRSSFALHYWLFLPVLSTYRAGQAAFLITLTEVMLFSPLLLSYVPKIRNLMCAICTRDNPSMDSILFPSSRSPVRTGKWIWPISFTIVGLLLNPTLFITYIDKVLILPIGWCPSPAGSLLSTSHSLNKVVVSLLISKTSPWKGCDIISTIIIILLSLMPFIFSVTYQFWLCTCMIKIKKREKMPKRSKNTNNEECFLGKWKIL